MYNVYSSTLHIAQPHPVKCAVQSTSVKYIVHCAAHYNEVYLSWLNHTQWSATMHSALCSVKCTLQYSVEQGTAQWWMTTVQSRLQNVVILQSRAMLWNYSAEQCSYSAKLIAKCGNTTVQSAEKRFVLQCREQCGNSAFAKCGSPTEQSDSRTTVQRASHMAVLQCRAQRNVVEMQCCAVQRNVAAQLCSASITLPVPSHPPTPHYDFFKCG